MLEHSVTKLNQKQNFSQAVISTLAFFALYELPLSARRVHELLLGQIATLAEVEQTLAQLVLENKIIQAGSLYSTKAWNQTTYHANQAELMKKWAKIDRYFNWLAILPFVRNISVINSLALGTADADSDIDFFVITKSNRLYFVRSMVIVLFRLLGVYKTRQKIKDKFCFGFFVTPKFLNFETLMLKPQDPYFLFWLASLRPVLGGQYYWQLMQENQWLNEYFPNFRPMQRLASVIKPNLVISAIKFVLEVMLWLPAALLEPILRRIHINHTFKLAENNTASSSTIANAGMLKLHAYDVRAEVAAAYARVLQERQ
jgi:hypothetical protein